MQSSFATFVESHRQINGTAVKRQINASEYEAVLTSWRGTNAKIWTYHLSLKRMALCLNRSGDTEVLYVIVKGCEHISGPFRWNQADIKIVNDADRLHVSDKNAGFHLVGSDITIAIGAGGVLSDPFDGFFH